MSVAGAPPTVHVIQYLRFVAALLVVVLHATHSLTHVMGGVHIPVFAAGVKGVDLFFVISGFIMVYVTRDAMGGGRAFFMRRLARVAPPYWLMTTALLSVALVMPAALRSTQLDPAHIVASYLFLPWNHPSNVEIQPFLHVGWSLHSELQFYLLFALAMALPLRARVAAVTASLLGLVALGAATDFQSPMLKVWTDPVLLEFLLGMGVGMAFIAVDRTPSLRVTLTLLATGLALISMVKVVGLYDPWRWLIAGAPAALIVAALLMLERAGRVPRSPALTFLGDASYALYLTHLFVIGFMRLVWPDAMVGALWSEIAFLTLTCALSVVIACMFYVIVEKPAVAAFQTMLAPSRRGAAAGGA